MKVDVDKLLEKCAAEDEGPSPVALGAGAVAGASPLLGLIGEKKIIHDPFRNKNIPRMNMEQLSRTARPGDVLITSKPSGSGWKLFQVPVGSEFYHAQPVIARRGGHGTTATAGQFNYPEFKGMGKKDLLWQFDEVKRALRADHYPDVTLMRPDKPLTPDEMKKFKDVAARRATEPYKGGMAVKAWLKDLFTPKIEGLGNRSFPGISKVCKGDVCSTLPAQSYWEAAKRDVHRGKLPTEILPADFLREGSGFSPVAARVSRKGYTPQQLARIKLLSRAGMGLGLGAGAYALADDPLNVAVPIGALALPNIIGEKMIPNIYGDIEARRQRRIGMGGKKKRIQLVEKAMERGGKVMPSYKEMLDVLGSPKPEHKLLQRRILTRTLPTSIAGGVGAYLLANKLRDYIQS